MSEWAPVIIQFIISFFALFGVIYQSRKQYDKHLLQVEADRDVLKTEFKGYTKLVEQLIEGVKTDIEKLNERVDEHNNYGREIPVIQEQVRQLTNRVKRLEEK